MFGLLSQNITADSFKLSFNHEQLATYTGSSMLADLVCGRCRTQIYSWDKFFTSFSTKGLLLTLQHQGTAESQYTPPKGRRTCPGSCSWQCWDSRPASWCPRGRSPPQTTGSAGFSSGTAWQGPDHYIANVVPVPRAQQNKCQYNSILKFA